MVTYINTKSQLVTLTTVEASKDKQICVRLKCTKALLKGEDQDAAEVREAKT